MESEGSYVPLFWRLFIPNACLLAAACVVLMIEPANGRIPALVELDRSRHAEEPERDAALDRSRAVAGRLLDDVRQLARSLRPEVLDELGLVPALTNLCDRLSAHTGLEIRRALADDLPPLGRDVQLVIYRVAHESLTNVVRHARTRRATVALARAGGDVELRIEDDGVGIRDASGSGGIRGMRERALPIGAVLTVGPAGAGGTAVRVRVPLRDSG
jgi:two-component system sensor histidine kinase UhpB